MILLEKQRLMQYLLGLAIAAGANGKALHDMQSFEDKRPFSLEHTLMLGVSGILSHLYF